MKLCIILLRLITCDAKKRGELLGFKIQWNVERTKNISSLGSNLGWGWSQSVICCPQQGIMGLPPNPTAGLNCVHTWCMLTRNSMKWGFKKWHILSMLPILKPQTIGLILKSVWQAESGAESLAQRIPDLRSDLRPQSDTTYTGRTCRQKTCWKGKRE